MYEYLKEGENVWTTIVSGCFTGEEDAVYLIRVKENDNASAGKCATVQIGNPVYINTNPPTDITKTSVTLNGYISSFTGVSSYGFYYSTDSENWVMVAGNMTDTTGFATGLSGLVPG